MFNRLLQLYNSYDYNNKIIEQLEKIINKDNLTDEDMLKFNQLLKEYHV